MWTVVVGAGSGQRFGTPKQYALLGDQRVLDRAVATARAASAGVIVVVPPGDAVREGAVAGGPTRSASVRAGLGALPSDVDIVCVHDAARPLASAALFERVVEAVQAGADAAVPAIAVTDTIKVVDDDGVVASTLDRRRLVAVQTPQAFRTEALRRAHATDDDGTDDAALVERVGGRVVTVPGEPWNRKITEPEDLDWARQWLAIRSS